MAKELHLTIYDQIGAGGFLFENGITAKAIQAELAANPEAAEIILHINSPGGSVYEGYTIYNILKGSGKKVTAKIEGICASIATLIALSAEEIEMMPLSQWLVHNPFTAIEGDADDLVQAAAELKRIEETLVGVYVAKTGKNAEEIRALMNEDRFLNAAEALELGFVSRISEPLKAVAFYNPPKTNLIDSPMDKTEKPSPWAKIKAKLLAAFEEVEETPQAATETLENGDPIYFEGELAEGVAVYSDAEMTMALPDGDYTLSDGRAISVAGGAITAIVEAAPANDASEELTAANARITELENQLLTIQNNATAKDTTIKNLRAELRTKTKATPPQNFAEDNSGGADIHPLDKVAKQINSSKK